VRVEDILDLPGVDVLVAADDEILDRSTSVRYLS
jgi:hypothetical protein